MLHSSSLISPEGSGLASESFFMPEKVEHKLEATYSDEPRRLHRVIDTIQFGLLLGRGEYALKDEVDLTEVSALYDALEAWRFKADEINSSAL